MRELCEHLKNFKEKFESEHRRQMTYEELAYLDAAQELIDSETAEPPDEAVQS